MLNFNEFACVSTLVTVCVFECCECNNIIQYPRKSADACKYTLRIRLNMLCKMFDMFDM